MSILSKIKKIFSINEYSSVSEKTIKGSLWLFVLRLTDQFLRFLKIIILARILSPNDFGIFGISIVVISIVDSFSQTGFQQALIQKKEDIREYLDTAWVIQVARGFALAFLLFVAAPLAANFFNTPQALLVIRILALSTLFSGFINIGLVHLQKDLQMHKYFAYQSIGNAIDFLATLTIALIWPNIWALVFGFLIGNVVRTIISYIIHPYWPRFTFNRTKAKELLGFGKWIFGSNIMSFFILQGDSIFIGKFLGVVSLGFYQMASKVASLLNTEIVSGALFPAYSKIQNNVDSLKKAYFKAIKLAFFIFIPMAGGIFSTATDIVNLFLGQKWILAIVPLQILIWSSLIWGIAVMTSPILQAVGRPKIETLCYTVRFLSFVILAYPAIIFCGIYGVASVVLLSVLLATSGFIFSASKIIKASVADFLNALGAPIFSTIIMIFAILWLNSILALSFVGFIIKVLSGAVIYFSQIYFFEKKTEYKITLLFKESLSLIRK